MNDRFTSCAALLLRLSLGTMWLSHGLLGDGAHALAFERKPVFNGRTA